MRIASSLFALLLALVAVGCNPPAVSLPAGHPARPDAPPGRLAGPPAALRPGVAADALVPPPPPEPGTGGGGHGSHGGAPTPTPPEDPPTGHEGHGKDQP